MTTVAVTREAMAADTRVVTGSSFYHANKIFRIGPSLLGTAGSGFACLAFVEWFKSPRRNPQVLHKMFGDYDRDDILIAELNPSGIFLWDGWGYPERINDSFYAIGSGAMAALEAMRNGVDPDDAVRRAVAHDENTALRCNWNTSFRQNSPPSENDEVNNGRCR